MWLIEKMYTTTHVLVHKQFSRIVGVIAELDYPTRWSNLLPNIEAALNAKTEKGALTGLTAMASLVKCFRYAGKNDRDLLHDI
jgi:hypothetical protein